MAFFADEKLDLRDRAQMALLAIEFPIVLVVSWTIVLLKKIKR